MCCRNSGIGGAVNGACPADSSCNTKFYAVVGGLFLWGMIMSSSRIPNTLVGLRAIDRRDKAASITVSISVLSLLAFLPSTIVIGSIIDLSCTIWGSKCGVQTNCLVYNTENMRLYVCLFVLCCMSVSFIIDIIVWFYVKDLKIYEEADQDFEDEKTDSVELQSEKIK